MNAVGCEPTEIIIFSVLEVFYWLLRRSKSDRAKIAVKDRSVVDKLINAMRKAGLPDKPPPAQP